MVHLHKTGQWNAQRGIENREKSQECASRVEKVDKSMSVRPHLYPDGCPPSLSTLLFPPRSPLILYGVNEKAVVGRPEVRGVGLE